MSQHDPVIRMKHMLDHAQEAIDLLGDMTVQELGENRERQLALTRLVEIVGEAASKVPPDIRDRHAHVPWRQAIGMRHVLAHGYDIVEHVIIWDTIHDSLPNLVTDLQEIIDRYESEG